MPPTDAIAVLRASHDHLVAVAGGLGPDAVRRRGYPSEWTIAQVLSHIGSGAEINMMTLEAGLSGQPGPGQDDNQRVWDRWDAKSPDQQAADALAADAALVEKIEANAGTPARITVWSGPTDVAGLAAFRLGEHVVHTWDVEVVDHPGATLLPDARPLLLESVRGLVGFAARPAEFTGVIHVTTTEPDGGYALTIGDPSGVGPWDGAATADATLTLPAEAFLRLVYGRLDPEHTPPSVTATGVDLDRLRATFPGF